MLRALPEKEVLLGILLLQSTSECEREKNKSLCSSLARYGSGTYRPYLANGEGRHAYPAYSHLMEMRVGAEHLHTVGVFRQESTGKTKTHSEVSAITVSNGNISDYLKMSQECLLSSGKAEHEVQSKVCSKGGLHQPLKLRRIGQRCM